MGWTNDQFAGTLTIPTGATSGQRIVIDGETGTITGYNSDDFVVFTITPGGGFQTFAAADEDEPAREAQLSSAQLRLKTDVPGVPDDDVIPTQLYTQVGTFPFGEEHITTTLQSGYTFGNNAPTIVLGSRSPDFNMSVDISTDEMSIGLTQDMRISGAGITINDVSQGRGRAAFEATQTSSATTTTTELAVLTTDNITFRAGRAYRIIYHGLLVSSVANDVVRARVWLHAIGGGAGGVSLVDSINAYVIPVANIQVLADFQQICVNNTGSDITDILIGTIIRGSGTGNVQLVANANNPAWLEVEDIGSADDYPGARLFT